MKQGMRISLSIIKIIIGIRLELRAAQFPEVFDVFKKGRKTVSQYIVII